MDKYLEDKIISYYTKYYRDDCCLKNYTSRSYRRLKEESNEEGRLSRLESLNINFHNKNHCIIGAGTGGLALVLNKKYNSQVFGIEPNQEALNIIKIKCNLNNIPENNFKLAYAENIPFKNNQFDFIHCHTVLEHVKNVSKSIDEMIRITKPSGHIYINTPNYSYPYEGHYKIPLPTFLSKKVCYLYLRLLGKSPAFLKTINFITEKKLNKILNQKNNLTWLKIYEPLTKSKGKISLLLNYLKFNHFIYPNQEIIITKK